MAIVLGPTQYGKAEVRLMHVDRSAPRHEITDLNVTTQLRGDFTATHLTGDNAHVVATDTQRNTVYALAREHGVGQIEDFALRLGRHFVDSFDWVTGARVAIEQYPWQRMTAAGRPHDHSFRRDGSERRTTVITVDGPAAWAVSGLADVVVLKTTDSEFRGFPRDRFTTLAETKDRILATSVTARWRYAVPGAHSPSGLDFGALHAGVRATLLDTFAGHYSLALQQTLYAMGRATLRAHREVAEIRLSMPNRHHVLVDLEPFEMDNPNTVFHATDRPYGLIEGTVLRDDAPTAGRCWE
jgi:urate oxidase